MRVPRLVPIWLNFVPVRDCRSSSDRCVNEPMPVWAARTAGPRFGKRNEFVERFLLAGPSDLYAAATPIIVTGADRARGRRQLGVVAGMTECEASTMVIV
jgi:hypothetical protein